MVGRTAWPRAFAAATALTTAACAASLMRLPAGPGVPAADAVDALAQATATCRSIKTLTAEIGISGSAGGRRVRGRLLAGAAAPASVRLEALAPFGAPVFIFVSIDDDATLLLPRDDRILEQGRPDAVLDAVAGVPLTGADLRTTLTGCAPTLVEPAGRSLTDNWRVVSGPDGPRGPETGSYQLYLRRDNATGPWRLVAVIREGSPDFVVRTEYRDFQNDLPRSIRVSGNDPIAQSGDAAFDLMLALSQVETNVPLGPEVFSVEVPASATPITVEELRRACLGIREN